MSRSILTAKCPGCGMRGSLKMAIEIMAKPIGTYSLAGQQMKVSAVEAPVLRCALCEMHIVGRLGGDGYAYFEAVDIVRWQGERPVSDHE